VHYVGPCLARLAAVDTWNILGGKDHSMLDRSCPTIKWTYKNYDVLITATDDSTSEGFTIVVEVDCTAVAAHRVISISKSFPTAAFAEQCGRMLARDWIDRNL